MQMSAEAGIKRYGPRAIDALYEEFAQLKELSVFEAICTTDLTPQQRRDALPLINLIKEKRCGKIKGRSVADGCKQRKYYSRTHHRSMYSRFHVEMVQNTWGFQEHVDQKYSANKNLLETSRGNGSFDHGNHVDKRPDISIFVIFTWRIYWIQNRSKSNTALRSKWLRIFLQRRYKEALSSVYGPWSWGRQCGKCEVPAPIQR